VVIDALGRVSDQLELREDDGHPRILALLRAAG
jgi:hypothetical protein